MKTDKQQYVLVCGRKDKPFKYYVPGSTIGECADCGCEVVMAPSSVKLTKTQKEVEIVCSGCALKRAGATPEEIKVALMPGQLEEINEYRKRN